jgi:pimeloyl-ACP methyl ester carboxylesterase
MNARALFWYLVVLQIISIHGLEHVNILGRKCIILPSDRLNNESNEPPIVLLGGTAQTTASWEIHIPKLSKAGSILVYECAGQGLEATDVPNLSIPIQAEELNSVLMMAFPHATKFNLVGFSMGARILMAYAVMFPNRIRKLHLTGVAAMPSEAGSVALASWTHLLNQHNLSGFSWSLLQATYSPSFLYRNIHRLPQWVQFIEQSNSAPALLSLLEETRSLEDWNPLGMAQKIKGVNGCLLVGEKDIMAPYEQALELTRHLGWDDPTIVYDCGHAIPTEKPKLWRDNVLNFLREG